MSITATAAVELTDEEREALAQTAIKNSAMFFLGYGSYDSIDQTAKERVDDMYEPVLVKCLSSYKWGFATDVAKLEAVQEPKGNLPQDFAPHPALPLKGGGEEAGASGEGEEEEAPVVDGLLYKYAAKYDCPKDFLRLLAIYRDPKENSIIDDYFLKGNVIYSGSCGDNRAIYLKYIKRLNSADLPSQFKEYFEYELAITLSFNFTGNSGDLQELLNYNRMERYRIAIELDTVQKKNFRFRQNPYWDCRV